MKQWVESQELLNNVLRPDLLAIAEWSDEDFRNYVKFIVREGMSPEQVRPLAASITSLQEERDLDANDALWKSAPDTTAGPIIEGLTHLRHELPA